MKCARKICKLSPWRPKKHSKRCKIRVILVSIQSISQKTLEEKNREKIELQIRDVLKMQNSRILDESLQHESILNEIRSEVLDKASKHINRNHPETVKVRLANLFKLVSLTIEVRQKILKHLDAIQRACLCFSAMSHLVFPGCTLNTIQQMKMGSKMV